MACVVPGCKSHSGYPSQENKKISFHRTYRSGPSYEEESSQSSDEKMDTASFRSQDTPNSTLSSDFEENPEPKVLDLQGQAVLRLSRPEVNQNTQKELSDSLLNKMSLLHIDSPEQFVDCIESPMNSNLERECLGAPVISDSETKEPLESPIISNLETVEPLVSPRNSNLKNKYSESPIISNVETEKPIVSPVNSNLVKECLESPIISNSKTQESLKSPINSEFETKYRSESVKSNLDTKEGLDLNLETTFHRSDTQMHSNSKTNDLFESVNPNLNKTFGHSNTPMNSYLEKVDRLEAMNDSNLETKDCLEPVYSNLDKKFGLSDTQINSNMEKINGFESLKNSDRLDTQINLNLENIEKLKSQHDSNNEKNISNLETGGRLELPKNKNLENRPKHLGISPPKFSTSLVLTTSHPLMSSPDYPDVVPKKDKEQDLSLSSFDDDRPGETNGYSMYSLNTNNSKNNLYFSENFTSAESHLFSDFKEYTPPDVAKVVPQRRKIIPRFVESPPKSDGTPKRSEDSPSIVLGRSVNGPGDETAILKYIEERNKKLTNHSTPKLAVHIDSAKRVAEWCESTQIQSTPKFELPIELSSKVNANSDVRILDSSAVFSCSPSGGALCQALAPPRGKRAIQLPPELEDSCSLDSIDSSLESEEEAPELYQMAPEIAAPVEENQISPVAMAPTQPTVLLDPDESKRSRSPPSLTDDSDPIPEYSAAEEFENERSYITVNTGDTHATCDMKVIEPFKRVLSHGGYDADGSAIIVFSACHLPDTHRPDYRYVMDNLFLYVMWTLDRLIGCEYVLVYLHGSAGSRRLPTFRWLHECYRLIDRRIRKSLKHLYLVHPTFWLKSFVLLTKPFVSSKFFRKLSYVSSLDKLYEILPVEPNAIPEIVRQYDQRR